MERKLSMKSQNILYISGISKHFMYSKQFFSFFFLYSTEQFFCFSSLNTFLYSKKYFLLI